MSVPTRLVGFLVALVAIFGGAVGVGSAIGPTGPVEPDTSADNEGMTFGGDTGMDDMDMGSTATATSIPNGLMVSQNGYTFRLARTTVAPGADVPVAFTIDGPDGTPVTDYDLEHDRELHLIAVRRDFTGFQHVHPEIDAAGTWTTSLNLTAGQWRIFADFKATGSDPLTLGNDLAVPGDYRPAAPAAQSMTAAVAGYTVTLDGDLAAGEEAELRLGVAHGGMPVTDLQPYLGAYGHLVALRAGDLAYLHVHPEGAPGDGVTEPGPEVVFYAEIPSPGRYHLYLNFKHQGVVRTAAFTVTGDEEPAPDTSDGEASEGGHSDAEH